MTSRAGLFCCTLALACGPTRDRSVLSSGSHRDTVHEPGAALLTEVMLDPVECEDSSGEWVEITNRGTEAFDLADLLLVDLDGNTSSITHWVLEPDAVALVGRHSESPCPTIVPDAFFGPLSLNNGGEQLALVDAETHTLLHSTPFFPGSTPGASWALDPDQMSLENSQWLESWDSSASCGAGEPTPGEQNPPCVVGDANWFGMSCSDGSCTLSNDFDPFVWLDQGWFHAQAQLDATAPGNPLMFTRVSIWADALDPASFNTSQLNMNLEFASPDWDEDEEWGSVVVMNRGHHNTERDLPNPDVLYLDDREEILERMQGFTLSQAAAELAETDPDFRISYGGYQWYTGDPNPTLELGDSRTFREIHWDAATGYRHDAFGDSFPF